MVLNRIMVAVIMSAVLFVVAVPVLADSSACETEADLCHDSKCFNQEFCLLRQGTGPCPACEI